MVNGLKENDMSMFAKYRLGSDISNPTFDVVDVLDRNRIKTFMNELAIAIGAPSEKIAASIFIKRYAFIAVNSLYAMTVGNQNLNIKLDNIEMEAANKGENWLPKFRLKSSKVETWNGKDREEWRKIIYQELFANNLFPIIDQFEKCFNISRLILWENIAVYLFWLYETELKDVQNPNVASDFQFLVSEAEGKLFGPYNNNPIKKYYYDKQYIQEFDEEVRVRKTCCFTYQLQNSTKRCKTCPCTHLTKEGACFDGKSICTAVRSVD